MASQPSYQLTLRPLERQTPAINRLRSALKALLRGYGFRCVACQVVPAGDDQQATDQDKKISPTSGENPNPLKGH